MVAIATPAAPAPARNRPRQARPASPGASTLTLDFDSGRESFGDPARRVAKTQRRRWFTATDLFCGAGGTTTGFEQAQVNGRHVVTTRQVVNHDPLAIASHEANHAAARHFIEDITKLDANLLGRTSLLWASLECFPAGTLVLTLTGLRPIEELVVGDLVLTHRKRWQPITHTMRRDKAATITVRGEGHVGLVTTAEHPFYVRQSPDGRVPQGGSKWIPAGQLVQSENTGWHWATPREVPTGPGPMWPLEEADLQSKDLMPADFWFLVGRWLRRGSTFQQNGELAGITLGIRPGHPMPEEFGLNAPRGLQWARRWQNGAEVLSAADAILARWLSRHFCVAGGKQLPGWVLALFESQRAALLQGYQWGEAGPTVARGKELAYGLRLLAVGLGMAVTVTGVQHGPLEAPWFKLTFTSAPASQPRDAHQWTRGGTVIPTGRLETVYNISVAGDESYVVEGIVVHNCTNFSNAKGGQSRDADSRSLAEHMERYIKAVRPLYFCVENVREFLSWGPLCHKKDKNGELLYRNAKVLEPKLDKNGKQQLSSKGKLLTRQAVNERGELVWQQVPVMVPESRTKGRDFLRWKQSIEDLGYVAHHRLLNAADFGERTSRIRLFMVFAKKGLPVRWPQATHSKNGKTIGTLPWLPVRPCLELDVKGRSIFNRVRLNKHREVVLDKAGQPIPEPLVEKTLKRLFAGLCQYIAGSTVPVVTAQLLALEETLASGLSSPPLPARPAAETEWLAKRTSNPPSGKDNPGASLQEPGPAVACGFHPDLVQTVAGEEEFLLQSNGGSPAAKVTPTSLPARTVLASPNQSLAQVVAQEFLAKAFTGDPSHMVQGTEQPAGSLTCVDHHQLGQVVSVGAEFLTMRHHTDPESRGRDLDQPALAVMPKDHHELAQVVSAAPQEFVTQYNGGSDECRNLSVESAINTITTENRFGVVQAVAAGAAATEFLTNPGWPERCGGASTQEPGPTLIARQDKAPLSLVQTVAPNETGFIAKYYSAGKNVSGLGEPAGSLTCTDRMALGQVVGAEAPAAEGAWLDKRYGSGSHNHQPLTGPAGSLLTNEHHVLAQVEPVADAFLDQQYGASGPASVGEPSGALTGIPKLNLVQTQAGEPEAWLVNTNFDNAGTSLDQTGPTLTASRHHPYVAQPQLHQPETGGDWLLDNKFDNVGRPLSESGPTLLTGDHHYLAQATAGGRTEPANWQFQADDSPTMRLIRLFLRAYNLADVLLRMLLVRELLRIQGFPDDYVLLGSATDRKRFIGNSVPPKMSQRITEALYEALAEANMLDLLSDYEGSLAGPKQQKDPANLPKAA